ncbi:MAG: CoA transferase, partial [Gammaproteobacteria bacterium]|nr:CoA transferase [Gammaproteobacteria bacterium]
LVCSWRQQALVRKKLNFEALHPRHPHLIYCHLTGFGSRGPLANLPGYEHLLAAYTGRMLSFMGIVDRAGPVFSSLQVGVHASAQSAATGILAALLERGNSGTGRLVETSMLQGMLPYEQGPMIGAQVRQQFPDLLPPMPQTTAKLPKPSLYYHPAQAKDGKWMQFGNLLPHLFDNFLISTDLIDIVTDPDFDAKQLMLPKEKHEAFRERMLLQIQQRTAQDWMTTFVADGGVVATTYQTTQDALDDPDIVANGHVISRKDGGVQLGPVAKLTKSPASPGDNAVPIDIHHATLTNWLSSPRPPPQVQPTGQLPMSGVKVVEIATIIAAPLGASFLADMGASVTKIEQIGGDPYRSMGGGIWSARVNTGKRSICVDLKAVAGRKVVLDLIGDADVIIHNFRPGVPERLGISYEQISAINPQIIYLQSNGYGPSGPGAQRPSTHPIPGAAMGGVLFQMAHCLPDSLQDFENLKLWTSRLMRANEVNPDPNTALVVATSILLGLVARQNTGQGQQIYIDMFGANAYANHDDFLRYPGKPKRTLPDQQLYGLSATYRLYPCANKQWIFLGLVRQHEQRRFVQELAEKGYELPSLTALQKGGTQVVEQLGNMFISQDADYWQRMLVAVDLGCVRADTCLPSEFWLIDPQVEALGLTAEVTHPQWGTYRRHGAMVHFDGSAHPLQCAPHAGQHNQELLQEYGYSAAQIAALKDTNVIWQE